MKQGLWENIRTFYSREKSNECSHRFAKHLSCRIYSHFPDFVFLICPSFNFSICFLMDGLGVYVVGQLQNIPGSKISVSFLKLFWIFLFFFLPIFEKFHLFFYFFNIIWCDQKFLRFLIKLFVFPASINPVCKKVFANSFNQKRRIVKWNYTRGVQKVRWLVNFRQLRTFKFWIFVVVVLVHSSWSYVHSFDYIARVVFLAEA